MSIYAGWRRMSEAFSPSTPPPQMIEFKVGPPVQRYHLNPLFDSHGKRIWVITTFADSAWRTVSRNSNEANPHRLTAMISGGSSNPEVAFEKVQRAVKVAVLNPSAWEWMW